MPKKPANPFEGIGRGRHYYQSRQAKELREELLELLGGECRKCGDEEDLEIHHVDGRAWEPRNLSSLRRAKRYWREYLAGVRLEALCARCNGWDGQRRMKPREREAWDRLAAQKLAAKQEQQRIKRGEKGCA